MRWSAKDSWKILNLHILIWILQLFSNSWKILNIHILMWILHVDID